MSIGIGKAYNTADHLIEQFIKAGILQEIKEKRRGQFFLMGQPWIAPNAYYHLLQKVDIILHALSTMIL